MSPRAAGALLLLAPACTFQPGGGFATLTGAGLRLDFDPGEARDLGGGEFLTDQAFAVRVDSLALDLGGWSIQSLSGAEGVDFDPSDPPAGYHTCHNGHCHADDGSLPSYAEIAASLAGGAATFEDVVRAEAPDDVDLLVGLDTDLVDGPVDLGLGELTQVRLGLRGLRLAGEVRDVSDQGRIDGVLPLVVDLALDDAVTGGLGVVVERLAPETVLVHSAWAVDGTLLDGLDLSAGDADPDRVVDNLLANPLVAAATVK